LNNESLLRFYEAIRSAVDADKEALKSGSRHYLAAGAAIRNYALTLQEELRRRGAEFSPIEWWYDRYR
jgi:hypothetical protein